MDALLQDLRFAARTLRQRPGFAAVAILTLALGIGANTAIFSVVDGVLLRPFPYAEADRIVTLWQHDRAAGVTRDEVSAANVLDWRERAGSFEAMAAMEPYGLDYRGPNGPVSLDTWLVTEDFFRVLGVQAMLGRTLVPEDYARTASEVYASGVPAVVLSHGVWRDRFGADSTVVGRTITLDGAPSQVVGVMPPEFEIPTGPIVWAPVVYGERAQQMRGANYLRAVGRLRPGVTPDQASAELSAVAARLAQEHPDTNADVGVTLVPLSEHLVGHVRPALLLLLGATGLVLLIACANVANLLLARGAGRRREMAIRAAMGAGRRRLIRQLATEGAFLALLGGLGGVLLASWGTDVILALAPSEIPRIDRVMIDGRVLLFALGVALLTGVLFGLVPALRLGRPGASRPLGVRGSSSGIRQRRLRAGLLVGEIALAMVLLVGTGLVVRSFVSLIGVDRGFRADRVLAVTVQAWNYIPSAEERAIFVREASARIAGRPGVRAVGMTSSLPLADPIGADEAFFSIEGRPRPPSAQQRSAHAALVTSGYFRALGVPLLQGRLFEFADDANAPPVVLINEAMARRYWPGGDPLGERVEVAFAGSSGVAEVVGVVGSVRRAGLEQEPEPTLYLPHAQAPTGAITFTVRTAGDPAALLQPVRETIWQFNSSMAIDGATTMDGLLSESLRERRFNLVLLGGFSLIALLLSAVGVYGVSSVATRERTAEIGVRLALGARPPRVMRRVLGDGLRIAVAGIAIGLVGALLLTRLLRSSLFGVSPTDPVTLGAVSLLLLAVALLACWLPARRAARTDPMIALRAE